MKHWSCRKAQRGFTLIEILVTTGLLVLCVGLTSFALLFGLHLYGNIQREADAATQLTRAFAVMKKDLAALVPDGPAARGDIPEGATMISSWNVPSPRGVSRVQYVIRGGDLVRASEGKERLLLSGTPLHFEVKHLKGNLGWVSLRYRNETLSQHVRIQWSEQE